MAFPPYLYRYGVGGLPEHRLARMGSRAAESGGSNKGNELIFKVTRKRVDKITRFRIPKLSKNLVNLSTRHLVN